MSFQLLNTSLSSFNIYHYIPIFKDNKGFVVADYEFNRNGLNLNQHFESFNPIKFKGIDGDIIDIQSIKVNERRALFVINSKGDVYFISRVKITHIFSISLPFHFSKLCRTNQGRIYVIASNKYLYCLSIFSDPEMMKNIKHIYTFNAPVNNIIEKPIASQYTINLKNGETYCDNFQHNNLVKLKINKIIDDITYSGSHYINNNQFYTLDTNSKITLGDGEYKIFGSKKEGYVIKLKQNNTQIYTHYSPMTSLNQTYINPDNAITRFVNNTFQPNKIHRCNNDHSEICICTHSRDRIGYIYRGQVRIYKCKSRIIGSIKNDLDIFIMLANGTVLVKPCSHLIYKYKEVKLSMPIERLLDLVLTYVRYNYENYNINIMPRDVRKHFEDIVPNI